LSLDDATIGVATTYTFDFMPGSPVPGKGKFLMNHLFLFQKWCSYTILSFDIDYSLF